MKRVLIAFLIFAVATTVFCTLRTTANTTHAELGAQMATWRSQTQQVAVLLFEKQTITEHWNETRHTLAAQPQPSGVTRLAEKILGGATSDQLSAAESEQLLVELGFNWNTTGEYLIISKKSLGAISFDALKGAKLTAVAEAALAITPAEKSTLQATLQQLNEARSDWVKAHVQREEPSGNILAKYSLPVDPEFSMNQLALFTNSVFNTLGIDRAKIFQDHSSQWLTDSGMRIAPDFSKVPAELRAAMPVMMERQEPQPASLTVERYKSGDEWYMNYHLKQDGNNMTTSVNPWQPFPEAFKPLFPGSWPDLAKAEGFELPKEFQKNKAR